MNGQLTIFNLYECDEVFLKSKRMISRFLLDLCKCINMKPYKKPLVERFGKEKLEGYSALLWIETSSIVIHLDEHEKKAFIDIFSCKRFNASKAKDFSKKYLKAKKVSFKTIMRK